MITQPLERRLRELVRLADRLASDARPARARRLEYLRLVGTDALWRMCPVPRLDDRDLRRVAGELGDPVELVQEELAEFFRLDLTDHAAGYAVDRQFFESNSRLGRDAAEFLEEAFPAPNVLYVVHSVLCGWHPEKMDASDIIVEGIDYDEEDDRFRRAINGFLASQGLAFASEVEVLAASFYDEWPSWDEFWDRYHGWGDHWADGGHA